MRKFLLPALAALALAPHAASADAITETPAGTLQYFSRSGMSVYAVNGRTYWEQRDNVAIEVVTGEDGDVYIKNIVGQLFDPDAPVWVKGTRQGDIVTMQLPQVAYVQTEDDGTLTEGTLYVLNNTLEASTPSLPTRADNQTVTFSVAADGTWTQQGDEILGIYLVEAEAEGHNGFQGFGEYRSVLEPVIYLPKTAPEGVEWEDWSLTYTDGGHRVQVARPADGNIYVRGLFDDVPEGIAVADTQQPGMAYFQCPQMLGVSKWGREFNHLFGARRVAQWNDEFNCNDYRYNVGSYVTLHYDQTGDALTGDEQTAMVTSCTAPEPSPTLSSALGDIRIFRQEDYGQAARPCNPVIHRYEAFPESEWQWGMGGFDFTTPRLDTKGGLLDPDYQYWSVYIDDEDGKLWLDTADYFALNEATDQVPATFTDGSMGDFAMPTPIRHMFYLYVTGFDRIGVQQIYEAGGETHVSDIVWREADGSITTQPIEDEVGIEAVGQRADDAEAVYYDLTGRRVGRPQGGVYIKVQGDKATKVKL